MGYERIRQDTDEEMNAMKKVFCVLLCTLLLFVGAGCASSANLPEIMSEYVTMLQEPANPESIAEIGAFLDQNLRVFETEHANQMLVAFEDYLFAFDQNSPDYRAFLERYKQYMSEDLAALYDIKAQEQEHPAVIDHVLQKSWEELSQRAHSLEILITTADHQIVREEAVRIFEYYIRLMLIGVSGTPIFDSDGRFNESAQNTYVAFSRQYADTTVAEVLREFIAYLGSIDFRIDFENMEETTAFSDISSRLVSEAGKRVLQ